MSWGSILIGGGLIVTSIVLCGSFIVSFFRRNTGGKGERTREGWLRFLYNPSFPPGRDRPAPVAITLLFASILCLTLLLTGLVVLFRSQ